MSFPAPPPMNVPEIAVPAAKPEVAATVEEPPSPLKITTQNTMLLGAGLFLQILR